MTLTAGDRITVVYEWQGNLTAEFFGKLSGDKYLLRHISDNVFNFNEVRHLVKNHVQEVYYCELASEPKQRHEVEVTLHKSIDSIRIRTASDKFIGRYLTIDLKENTHKYLVPIEHKEDHVYHPNNFNI